MKPDLLYPFKRAFCWIDRRLRPKRYRIEYMEPPPMTEAQKWQKWLEENYWRIQEGER